MLKGILTIRISINTPNKGIVALSPLGLDKIQGHLPEAVRPWPH
jgi:hypothetical protein